MKQLFIKSSNIDSGTYNDETKELTITFKSGKTYIYYDVSPVTVNELEMSTSQSKYLNGTIAKKHKYEKI